MSREPSRVPQLGVTELQTGPNPVGSVIWMHGLGADGHDFEPIVPQLVRPDERPLRFVFPHAPVRPVTINNGYAMRAWYDIIGIDRQSRQDEAGVRGSDAAVRALIRRENDRGIPTERIVLAGFSQGAAMALFSGTRYPKKLAGLMGLSGYMVLAPTFDAERDNANQTVPIFLAHGMEDQVVPLQLGEDTHQLLEATQYSVEWHTYPMPHAVCPQEVADIAEWLRRVV
jgi:phospholipase/carboxylesterase